MVKALSRNSHLKQDSSNEDSVMLDRQFLIGLFARKEKGFRCHVLHENPKTDNVRRVPDILVLYRLHRET